jgi:hypothetical protein
MVHALDKVFGHLVLLVVLELAVVVPAIVGGGLAYHGAWGLLAVIALGGLGLPFTVLVPWMITNDQVFLPVTLLIAAPIGVFLLRFIGYYLRVDQPKNSLAD